MRLFPAALAALALTPLAAAAQAFTVTNQSITAYLISKDGAPAEVNPTLILERGRTYTFNVNAQGHPFYIKTARVTGGASQYTEGVTNQGVAVGTLTFQVPANAPSTLHYQCWFHLSMGGVLQIIDPLGGPSFPPAATFLLPPVPNPWRGPGNVTFGISRPGRVAVEVFDPGGRLVRTLARGNYPAGGFSLPWDLRGDRGERLGGGLYYVRLRTDDQSLSRTWVVTP